MGSYCYGKFGDEIADGMSLSLMTYIISGSSGVVKWKIYESFASLVSIFSQGWQHSFDAVAYWRYLSSHGNINISFVASKAKCAPLKRATIPRLELQAAVIGTRLMQNILSERSLVPGKCVLWGDSKTVLKWIANSHRWYKPYVAHRIAEFLATTKMNDCRWVSMRDNVADEATRSSNKIDFSSSSRWMRGLNS